MNDTVDFDKLVGDRIKYVRTENKMTQEAFAAELGHKRFTIAKMETGAKAISFDFIMKVMMVFNVSLSVLVPLDEIVQNKQLESREPITSFLDDAKQIVAG